jgi:hypothetical protein
MIDFAGAQGRNRTTDTATMKNDPRAVAQALAAFFGGR